MTPEQIEVESDAIVAAALARAGGDPMAALAEVSREVPAETVEGDAFGDLLADAFARAMAEPVPGYDAEWIGRGLARAVARGVRSDPERPGDGFGTAWAD